MKRQDLAQRLAKEAHITPAAAADQLDRVVSDILKRVRQGQTASLPGLGTFRLDEKNGLQFDRNPSQNSEPGAARKDSR